MAATDAFACAGRRVRAHVTLGRWLVTSVATVASTYALDAVATVAGVLLVASGVLAGLGHAPIVAFLAASYVAWAAGLWLMAYNAKGETVDTAGGSATALLLAQQDERLRRANA